MALYVERAGCALLLLLSLTGIATAQAADVSIVPAARTVTLECRRLQVPDQGVLSVHVSRHPSKGVYVYRYTLSGAAGAAPSGVDAVHLRDLAGGRIVSTFKGASPCNVADGNAACPAGADNAMDAPSGAITLESTAPPGIVRYSLIGRMADGPSDEDLQRLVERFGGDRALMLASIDDVMSNSCPYSTTEDPFERGITGTLLGPSQAATLTAVITGALGQTSEREVELQSTSESLPIENLDHSSIVVTDSRLQPVQVGPSALERRKDGTPVVRFTLDVLSGHCHARNVLVRAKLLDGTPLAASLDVEPPACAPQVDQALLVLPSG